MENFKTILFLFFFLFRLQQLIAQRNEPNFLDKFFLQSKEINHGSITYSITKKHLLRDDFKSSVNQLLFSHSTAQNKEICFILKKSNGSVYFYDFNKYYIFTPEKRKINAYKLPWKKIRNQLGKELCPLISNTEQIESGFRKNDLLYWFSGDTILDGHKLFFLKKKNREVVDMMGYAKDSNSTRTTNYFFDTNFLPFHFDESLTYKNDSEYTSINVIQAVVNQENTSSEELLSSIHRQLDSLAVLHIPIEEKIDSALKPTELLKPGAYAYNMRYINTNGDTLRLSNVDSKLTLLSFSYISCVPCQLEISILNHVNEKYKNQGLKVISIDPVDDVRSESMKNHILKNNINYEIGTASRVVVLGKFNVDSYPAIYLLDKNKKIIFANQGYGETLETKIEEAIEKNLQ